MKKRVLYCLLLIVLALFSSCSTKKEVEESGFNIYYVDQEATKVVGEAYTPKSIEKNDLVEEIINELALGPESPELQKALPEEIDILGYTFGEAGQLILNFSTTYYSSLEGIREILARAAIVRTFSQIDGIEYVEFNVNSQQLKLTDEVPVSMMKASDFIDNTGKATTYTQNAYVILYFSNKNGKTLIETSRQVNYDGVISLEQLIIEQLIAGPVEGEEGAISTLPEGTKLNEVKISDNICYVNFNEAFLEITKGISEEVKIYSVVNSLVEQLKINKVQILIDGEIVSKGQSIALDSLFERNLDIIENVN